MMDMSLDITRALKVSIRGLPKDWRHPPGRPRHTWLLTLDADLQPHNFGLSSAWKYAQDREQWKHLVVTAMLQLGVCTWWRWWILTHSCCYGCCRNKQNINGLYYWSFSYMVNYEFCHLFIKEVYDVFGSDFDASIFQLCDELVNLQRLTQKQIQNQAAVTQLITYFPPAQFCWK